MAHLTKPTTYNIEDSNIALLGSDVSYFAASLALDRTLTLAYLESFLSSPPPSLSESNGHFSLYRSRNASVKMLVIMSLLGTMQEKRKA
jgi:hypothetical protein